MKKFKILVLSLVMIFSVFRLDSFATYKEMRAAWISTVYNMDWPKTKNNISKQKQEYIEMLDKLKGIGINTVVYKEMRAAWISTVYNMDWPKTKNNISKQKQEYIEMLDKLKGIGINTVVFQVRPKSDALYNSSINPWSDVLTGTQGKNPGYDPLAFAIEESHKRGMEIHAWFNPYRVTTSGTDINKLASNNQARLHQDWLLEYNSGSNKALMYNPGLPEVRKHIVDTVSEVVRNYNVDGIHFDDYFYRDGMDDDDTYKKYGNGLNKGDWRRENVNTLLREVKSAIKLIKPNVEFGVSPSGIWKNKSSDPTGSDTRGFEHYSKSYADSRTWIREGLIDYIVPQIYWTIGYSAADYSKLVSWWSNEVKGYNVDLYIGQGVYRQGGSDSLNIASEIKQQINLNRKYSEVKGSMYFSTRDILKNEKLQNDIKDLYTKPSTQVKSLQGNRRFETAVAISKEGWNSNADTVIIASAYSVVDGVSATPLASIKNAPILLVDKNEVTNSTKEELKRLNPSNIIVIGGTNVVNDNTYNELKSILPSASIKRIGGINRYETSLNIAKEMSKYKNIDKVYVAGGHGEADALSIASKAGEDKAPIILTPKDDLTYDSYSKYKNIDKVYVAGGHGEADALSIASKAGEDKAPIILTPKDDLTYDSYDWLKSQNLLDAYFIGGDLVISDNVINKVNSVTSNNVLNNRVDGLNRQETNAKVIQKFYTNSNYNALLVTKSNPLVDALSAGPLAAKKNSPIVLVSDTIHNSQKDILSNKSTTKSNPLVDALSAGPLAAKKNSPIVLVSDTIHNSQKDILSNKSTNLVYQVGGGINQNSFNSILDILK